MKKLLHCIAFFVVLFSLSEKTCAQVNPIEISYEKQSDNSVDFKYKKVLYGTYFLEVKFNDLSNANPGNFTSLMNGHTGSLFSLNPKNGERGIGFSYSYRYQRGKPNPRIKDDLIYMVPFKKGVKSKMHNLSFLGAKLGKVAPETWKAFQFITDQEEFIVAARKGMVVEVTDEFTSDTTRNYSFTRSVNEIIIEHKDGSLAKYSGFKAGSIKVKPGDRVNPNTELGLSGRYDADKSYELRLVVFYLNTRDLFNLNTDAEKANQYGYVNPVFCYKGGKSILRENTIYVADCNDEIITQEFSRREKKKYTSIL